MALDKVTMEFCIEQCASAVASSDVFEGLGEYAKGQSKMAESLANQLKNAQFDDVAAQLPATVVVPSAV